MNLILGGDCSARYLTDKYLIYCIVWNICYDMPHL